jgi:hypothetical protein
MQIIIVYFIVPPDSRNNVKISRAVGDANRRPIKIEQEPAIEIRSSAIGILRYYKTALRVIIYN